MATLTAASTVGSTSQRNPSSGTASEQTLTLTPSLVGQQFVKTYYDVLSKKPEHLFRFYKEDSQFTFASGILDAVSVHNAQGQENIRKLVQTIPFGSCHYRISSLVAQGSTNGSILVQVTGVIALGNSPVRYFSQSFVLNPQEKGFYVRNDMLHLLQEATTSAQSMRETKVSEGTPLNASKDVSAEGSRQHESKSVPSAAANITSQGATVNSVEHTKESPSHATSSMEESRRVSDNAFEEKAPRAEDNDRLTRIDRATKDTKESVQERKSWASVVGLKPAAPSSVTGSTSTPTANVKKATASSERTGKARSTEMALSRSLVSNMLFEEFSRYGKVLNVDLYLDRGFAFVDMEQMESVQAAVDAWNAGPPETGSLTGVNLTVQHRRQSGKGGRGNRDGRGKGYSANGGRGRYIGGRGGSGPRRGNNAVGSETGRGAAANNRGRGYGSRGHGETSGRFRGRGNDS
eukprot:jgi/Galph1/5838/GphlegSOOS_G4445.1